MPLKKQYLKSRPEVKVTFEIDKQTAAQASNVFLLGEFNGWEPLELKKLKSGTFKTVVNIAIDQKDQFEYKYRLVDDQGTERFENDPEADAYCPNYLGEENSVLSLAQ